MVQALLGHNPDCRDSGRNWELRVPRPPARAVWPLSPEEKNQNKRSGVHLRGQEAAVRKSDGGATQAPITASFSGEANSGEGPKAHSHHAPQERGSSTCKCGSRCLRIGVLVLPSLQEALGRSIVVTSFCCAESFLAQSRQSGHPQGAGDRTQGGSPPPPLGTGVNHHPLPSLPGPNAPRCLDVPVVFSRPCSRRSASFTSPNLPFRSLTFLVRSVLLSTVQWSKTLSPAKNPRNLPPAPGKAPKGLAPKTRTRTCTCTRTRAHAHARVHVRVSFNRRLRSGLILLAVYTGLDAVHSPADTKVLSSQLRRTLFWSLLLPIGLSSRQPLPVHQVRSRVNLLPPWITSSITMASTAIPAFRGLHIIHLRIQSSSERSHTSALERPTPPVRGARLLPPLLLPCAPM